jgi:hypothetical protein
MRAWTSLISALQNNGFICQSVFYQIPAVISSKAQMSLKSSYISDVYSVYTLCPDMKPTRDLSPLMTHLRFIANSRGGRVAKTILDREFIIAWLKNNIDHNMLSEKDSIIGSMFDYDKKTTAYRLKEEYREQTELLKDAVIEAMKEIVYQGSYSLLDSYLKVSEKCERFGTMELAEFKEYTEGFAVENGKVYGYTQLSIFDLT